MNLRLLVAIALSLLVIFLYQFWVDRYMKKETATREGVRTEEIQEKEIKTGEEVSGVQPGRGQPKEGITYKDIVVDTPLYSATFTTFEGRLKNWRLKNYTDKISLHPLGRIVQNLVKGIFGRKRLDESPPQHIDIVNTRELTELPLGIRFSKGGIGHGEGEAFIPSAPRIELNKESKEGILTFQWKSPTAGQIEKKYRFYPDRYTLDLEITVLPPRKGVEIKDTFELEWIGDVKEKKGNNVSFGPVYYTDGGLRRIKPKELKKGAGIDGRLEWFAYDEHYFISLIYPSYRESSLMLRSGPEDIMHASIRAPIDIKPREKTTLAYTIFMGPKIPHLLSQVTPTAKKAVDYGWLNIIAIPILKILGFTHRVTGNYGLDIIILALLIKIIFTPLTHKSQESMKEMQKLQPEIKRLQQKYKEDKQQLNREIMEIYKRRKVNPFSGCLPLLLQLPVFYALFRAFSNSIELRHSPFILWIRDLTDKDPTYITPLLMGATMYFQQKMSTVAADPTQSKMMSLMPIFFTFFFLNFPSGLVLYWLVTNVLSIGHQMYINRQK